jgi:hypothetical protein
VSSVERSSGGKLDIILLDELKRGSNRKELRKGTSTMATLVHPRTITNTSIKLMY